MKVGDIERDLGEGSLIQSTTTGIITTHDELVGLVYIVGLKIKHIQGKVCY